MNHGAQALLSAVDPPPEWSQHYTIDGTTDTAPSDDRRRTAWLSQSETARDESGWSAVQSVVSAAGHDNTYERINPSVRKGGVILNGTDYYESFPMVGSRIYAETNGEAHEMYERPVEILYEAADAASIGLCMAGPNATHPSRSRHNAAEAATRHVHVWTDIVGQ